MGVTVDSRTPIRDNLCDEETVDTNNDTKTGSVRLNGKHTETDDCKEVTKHVTKNV